MCAGIGESDSPQRRRRRPRRQRPSAPCEAVIPIEIVDQLDEHLPRLDVLEPREWVRVVRRKARTSLTKE
jgi:hypothetical protein